MAEREILLLGDERLYKVSKPILEADLPKAKEVLKDLHDTMTHFRKERGFGRAIAAPQIGESYRIIYMYIDGKAIGFINPKLDFLEDEQFELWDDCMSFPGLEVKVLRYKRVRVSYKDENWQDCSIDYEGDLAELIQHEYDHLDGILAVQRAIDPFSFRMQVEK
ncbi:peptide deformylase [Vallitalea okinawensis]|uniref:peptide deformylase n=1 Tax=Vallitalea okinawensis TaxID=2078660 RepID=UPI000CFB5539|nr:peptide deformylase [Vallitalea okinawensis]